LAIVIGLVCGTAAFLLLHILAPKGDGQALVDKSLALLQDWYNLPIFLLFAIGIAQLGYSTIFFYREYMKLADVETRFYRLRAIADSEGSVITFMVIAIGLIGFAGTLVGISGALGSAVLSKTQTFDFGRMAFLLGWAFYSTFIALAAATILRIVSSCVSSWQKTKVLEIADRLVEERVRVRREKKRAEDTIAKLLPTPAHTAPLVPLEASLFPSVARILPRQDGISSTGVLIAPRVVLTTAHSVYAGGLVVMPIVTFAEGKSIFSSQSMWSVEWEREVSDWVLSSFDIAALILPVVVDRIVSPIPFDLGENVQLSGAMLSIAGYPADPPEGTDGNLWGCSMSVSLVTETHLFYPVENRPGMSGSPVYFLNSDGTRVLVGIHVGEFRGYGVALRIKGDQRRRIKAWIDLAYAA
jgi:V8-like Glu-specific endopeptidase